MDKQRIDIRAIGGTLVDVFHYLALFVIGATVIWSAVYEYLQLIDKGYASLEDILLLFIYLELGAMIGIYFKTNRLPVQFLIFIAITALSRHLLVDTHHATDINLILAISGAILLLSGALIALKMSKKYTNSSKNNDN